MDFYVSSQTLDCLEEVIYDINLELLKTIHKKYLSKLDFQELVDLLEGNKKKKFILVKDGGKIKRRAVK